MKPPTVLRTVRTHGHNNFAIAEDFFGQQDKIRTFNNDTVKKTAQKSGSETPLWLILFVPFDCLLTDCHRTSGFDY